MPLVYLNGELVEEDEAKISVFDHGLVVGDGVFETILLYGGHAFALSRHLERMTRSAKGLGLNNIDFDQLRKGIELTISKSGLQLGRIRVTITAGYGPLGSGRLSGPATIVVAIAPEDGLDHGFSKVAVTPWTRNERGALAGLKTTSYAENALALAFAAERGADEAIFANNRGELCEGTGSNVFVVRDGELLTPPLSSGCLAGTTRALVLERFGGTEADIELSDFSNGAFEEAFLASSIRGVQAIRAIDTLELPSCPGPVTSAAASKFQELLDNEIDP